MRNDGSELATRCPRPRQNARAEAGDLIEPDPRSRRC